MLPVPCVHLCNPVSAVVSLFSDPQNEISRPLGTITYDMLVLAMGEEGDWLKVICLERWIGSANCPLQYSRIRESRCLVRGTLALLDACPKLMRHGALGRVLGWRPYDEKVVHGRIVYVDRCMAAFIPGCMYHCRRRDGRQGPEPGKIQNQTLVVTRSSSDETTDQQHRQTTPMTTQINFESHRGVYVKHTMTDPQKASKRRCIVMTRMTLPAARSAAKVAASTAHLSATAGGVGVGTLASTLARPVTLASSRLSTLGHAAATGLHALAYTLHHGEAAHGLRHVLSQKTMLCRLGNACVATAKGEACDQAADGGFILVAG